MNPAPRGYDFDAIRTQHSIEVEASKHTTLKRVGRELVGLCPIHDERTPSFKVYPDKERFKCFGCGEGGDVLDLVQAIHDCTVQEAVDILTGGKVAVMNEATRSTRDRLREERVAEERAAKAAGARRANARWVNAASTDLAHPYLVRKSIAELFEDYPVIRSEGANLLIPVYDAEGELQSVQTIPAEPGGKKLFAKDAPAVGGRFQIGIGMGRIVICEGFATGATLAMAQSDQVCIAFSADNMERVAREIAAAGVFVVLAVDQDKEEKFTSLAREIGAIAVVARGPDKGWDWNDEHCAKGLSEVRAQIDRGIAEYALNKARAEAELAAEEGPLDLWKRSNVPAFPATLLPPLIARFARIRADMVGCDPSGLAVAALAACSAVIRDTIQLRMKKHDAGWKEEARLWVMLVGDPSRKKTPILRAATKRVADIDAAMSAQYQRDMQDWVEAGSSGPPPVPQRLRISDITMEAAAEVCASNPHGILAVQDELSGWFGGIEKYSGGKGGAKDRSFWLQAFNGGHYATDRIGRKAAFVENLSISMVGGVQPDPIRRIMSDATDDGLIQRFFPIMLGEPVRGQDIEMPDVAGEYDAMIDRLHALKPPENWLGVQPLVFSEDAQALRCELEAKHLDMMTAFETINKKIASHIGKYDGLFGRLALLFHCIEHVTQTPEEPLSGVIQDDTARRAANFLHRFLNRHALAFYINVAGLTDDHEIITDVAGYILTRKEERVSLRTLARGTRAMRRLTRFEGHQIFEQMAAYGWLEEVQARGDTSTWIVNPLAHELFADRAEMERERRENARSRVNEYLRD